MGSSLSLSVQVSLSLCRSIYPPLCAGSPSVGSSLSLSLCAGLPLSVQVYLPPFFVQDPPLWVVPPLSLSVQVSLPLSVQVPPPSPSFCAGSPLCG